MVWEHEVYTQIEYKSPRPYLHTFEAEEYMTAFNFASEKEAVDFRNIFLEKIPLQKQMRDGYSLKNSKASKQKTNKSTKAKIGAPQDFRHLSHLKWDANIGFNLGNMREEEMRSFFSKAGVSDSQLRDVTTREFIYDFINKNGGINAVKEELHEAPKRKAPCIGPPSAPPPQPPGAAPPPPPPLAPLVPHAFAPPPVPQPPLIGKDMRAAIMENIHSGNKTLRHVDAGSKTSLNDDSRDNLLSEIREGIKLRSVTTVTQSCSTSGEERGAPTCGLAAALAKAIEKRARAIHSSDSESDTETSDREWDD